MGELFLLMVKPWLAGVLSLVQMMEGSISCLARSSQPKHISRMQVPESTPTTPSNSRVFSRRFPSKGATARLSVVHILASFLDSKHAAGVLLGTVQTRANVQLGLACQRLLLQIQVTLRFTMQHIYGHAQNLGNECADHAAALGACGLVSNQNVSARWARPSIDCILCFATCDSLGGFFFFEKLSTSNRRSRKSLLNSRMESHVTSTLGGFGARLTEIEEIFSTLTVRMGKIETGVTSASSQSLLVSLWILASTWTDRWPHSHEVP